MGCGSSTDSHINLQHKGYPKQAPRPKAPPLQPPPKINEGELAKQGEYKLQQINPPPLRSNYPPVNAAVDAIPVRKQDDKEKPSEEEFRPISITRQQLERYVHLEKEINKLEMLCIGSKYQVQSNQLKSLEMKMNSVKAELQKQKIGANAETRHSKDVAMQLLSEMNSENTELNDTQVEMLENLSTIDMLQTTLAQAENQHKNLLGEVRQLRSSADILNGYYQEQEKLLSTIFNGCYGSEREMWLEEEHDAALEAYKRIDVSRNRWQAARLLIATACKQMEVACTRWQTLIRLPSSNPIDNGVRIALATEAKNNLTAAIFNVNNAQLYVGHVEFPYCKAAEMNTMQVASNNVYADMNHSERQYHALQCYTVCYQRCCALLQWMDHVIDGMILRDLEIAIKNLREKDRALRIERVHLLQEKLRSETDETFDINLDFDGNFSDADNLRRELAGLGGGNVIPIAMSNGDVQQRDASTGGQTPHQKQLAAPDHVKAEPEPDFHESSNPDVSSSTIDQDLPPKPAPLPLSELAEPPSQESLFGAVMNIEKRHEKQINDYSKAQEAVRSKMDQDVEQKLAARRSRKAREIE